MKILIAGGAGFLGSHLCEHYCEQGDEVICLDNLVTGRLENIKHLRPEGNFRFRELDVTEPLPNFRGKIDVVFNLASPASPVDYSELPIETLRVGSLGTENLIRTALNKDALFIHTSTSEVYGDPAVHPQPESYWGNVNPIGPRSVYDESKRYAEAIIAAYARKHDLKAGVVRIFNTYGPRLAPSDGRVVSNFITQALSDRPLTVYGEGNQTRSLCYVSDLIAGLVAMAKRTDTEPGAEIAPVNLGNPNEITVMELARKIIHLTESRSEITFLPLPKDDPTRRCPDISRAKEVLDWQPLVSLDEGLGKTINWFRETSAGRPEMDLFRTLQY